MIQRIQSVYLLVTAILIAITAFMPIAYFTGIDSVAADCTLRPLGMRMPDGHFQSTFGLFALLLLTAIVILGNILLYKARMLQIRLIIFAGLLLVGFYLVFAVFAVVISSTHPEATFRIGWALCLPLVGLILLYLAFRGIYRDEILVRSINRLR